MRPPRSVKQPLQRLGLVENPFRVMGEGEVLDRLMDPAILGDAEARLRSGAHVVQVVGQSGWGKTTRLIALKRAGEQRLHERWVSEYVRPESTGLTIPPPPLDCWCIDEAQRMRPALLRRIIKRARHADFRLVVGTHVSIEHECRTAGVEWSTIRLAPPTIRAIERFTRTRILAALRNGLDAPRPAPAALDLLDRQTAGNLHLVEEILYEVFQEYVEQGMLPGVISERDVADAIQRRASAY